MLYLTKEQCARRSRPGIGQTQMDLREAVEK